LGTNAGVLKVAAGRLGMTVEEYMARRQAGEKWCYRCDRWKPIDTFGQDKTRGDGHNASCLDCGRVAVRVDTKGRPSTFKGRTHTREARRKMGEARRGNQNRTGKPFTPEQLAYLRQRTIQNAARGERSPNWKGGVTPQNKLLRQSPQYADWRSAVFARDNYSCCLCGDNRGGNLHAHHICSWADYPQLRFEVSNGQTLCASCHAKVHDKPDSYRKRRRARRQAPAG
jgi:HNH endonuclease/NUMOD3 motif